MGTGEWVLGVFSPRVFKDFSSLFFCLLLYLIQGERRKHD